MGRVLFFTAPPLDVGGAGGNGGLAHSVEWLAGREEREGRKREWRKRKMEGREGGVGERVKRMRGEEGLLDRLVAEVEAKAVSVWGEEIARVQGVRVS